MLYWHYYWRESITMLSVLIFSQSWDWVLDLTPSNSGTLDIHLALWSQIRLVEKIKWNLSWLYPSTLKHTCSVTTWPWEVQSSPLDWLLPDLFQSHDLTLNLFSNLKKDVPIRPELAFWYGTFWTLIIFSATYYLKGYSNFRVHLLRNILFHVFLLWTTVRLSDSSMC